MTGKTGGASFVPGFRRRHPDYPGATKRRIDAGVAGTIAPRMASETRLHRELWTK